MDDNDRLNVNDKLNIRYLGRLGQAYTLFGKFARVFIYQNDWITLPMSALIAGLVSLALGKEFGISKEGTFMGVFALVCVCLWNGTFNSIQIICRERDVVKREHRSGMHISSYILAHMIFQAIICILQCIITLFTANIVGMKITGEGLFTPFLVVDVAITLFFVTYAADMLALFISAIVRTTTIAMTIMPFILIFQMVFSGGLFPLPDNINFISITTVSAPGFDALASQMDVDKLPYRAVGGIFDGLEKYEMDVELKGSDILDALSDESNESIKALRDIKVGGSMSAEDAYNLLLNDKQFENLRNKPLINRITIGNILDAIAGSNDNRIQEIKDTTIEGATTIREAIQIVLTDENLEYLRNADVVPGVTLRQLLSAIISIGNDVSIVGEALDTGIEGSISIGDIIELVRTNNKFQYLYDVTLLDETSIGEALRLLMDTNVLREALNNDLSYYTNVGDIIDYLNNTPAGDEYRNLNIVYHVKFKDVIDRIGRDEIMKIIEDNASTLFVNREFENSRFNVGADWIHLIMLIIINAVAAIIALEFIDRDKR